MNLHLKLPTFYIASRSSLGKRVIKIAILWRLYTQHKKTQHNKSQHNKSQRNKSQHKKTQHNN